MERTSWTFAGDGPIADGELTVDENVADAGGRKHGIEESGFLGDRIGIEDDEVGLHAGADEAAVVEAQALGGEAGHLADGVLKGEDFQVADVAFEDADKGAGATRVAQTDAAVGGNHRVRPLEDALDVVLIDPMEDGAAAALGLDFHGQLGGVADGGLLAARFDDGGEGLAFERAVKGAVGEDDVVGVATAALFFDTAHDFGLNFGALLGSGEAFLHGAGAAAEGVLGDEGGAQSGPGGGIRVLVDGGVYAAGARFVHEAESLLATADVGLAAHFVVGDLGGESAFFADTDGFLHGVEDLVGLVADVGNVEAAEFGHDFAEGDDFFRGGEVSRGVEEAGGEADGAVAHGLAGELAHAVELGGGGGPVLHPENILADGAVAYGKGHVDAGGGLGELIEGALNWQGGTAVGAADQSSDPL